MWAPGRGRAGRTVLVVGAGVGGLTAAWQLKNEARRRGVPLEVRVLEARARVGGSIVTERVGDCLVEGGPDCFVTDKAGALELIADLGLADHLAPTNDGRRKTYVLWNRGLHSLPDGLVLLVPTRVLPFVTSTLFTWRGKLRMALDLILPRRREGADETLGDFIRRRLGAEALERLGEPLVAGIHSGDPETMSVRATFPRFIEMERQDRSLIVAMLRRMRTGRQARAGDRSCEESQTHRCTMFMTLDRGLGFLIEELVRSLGEGAVLTGRRVVSVERGRTGYWLAETAGGECYSAEAVILACPAYETARILEGLDRELAADLARIPYVSSATVSLAYSAAAFPREPDGFGVVIPKGEKRRIKAFTWVTSKFFDRAPPDVILMRVFIRAPMGEVPAMSDDEMSWVAHEELAGILGLETQPLWSRVYRWERAMPQYVVGHLEWVARIEERVGRLPGLALAGGAYHGSGIPDTSRLSRHRASEVVDYLADLSEDSR